MAAREPFVAIMGGFWEVDSNDAAEAKKAAKVIGIELAKAGFGLVVYNSDDASLEPHVVEGYVSALSEGKGKIRVRCSKSQTKDVRYKEDQRDGLFEYQDFTQPDWQAPFFRSLAEDGSVDGVVLMAGAQTVLIAGNIALARRLPILAVDQFGGSAEKIWTELAQHNPDVKAWHRRTAAEFIQDLKQRCDRHIGERETHRKREAALAAMSSERFKTILLYAVSVALAACVVIGLAWTPHPATYLQVMLIGLILAGASGSMIGGVRWGFTDSTPTRSLVMGALAGLLVGVAYFIPLWVAEAGLLSSRATEVLPKDKIQFLSSILVAFAGGIGFEAVLARFRNQAEVIPISPPLSGQTAKDRKG
jgi:hypothetical protein